MTTEDVINSGLRTWYGWYSHSGRPALRWFCFLALVSLAEFPAFPGERSLSSASSYLIDRWEIEDGLPENSATAMAQTPDGYLWFGTFNGLVRFDGVKFTVFNPKNTPALANEGIVNLHCDRGGRLWVSTYQGLTVLQDGEWRQVTKDDGRASNYARTITERTNGDILFTGFAGTVFEFSEGRLTELPSPPGEPNEGYLGGVDEAGHWWVVQNRFIGQWDGRQWVQKIAPPDLRPDAVSCAPARDGGLWLVLGRTLCKLRHGAETSRVTLPEALSGIWRMSEDSRSNLWIATHDRGFCRIDPRGVLERWSATNGWSDHTRFVLEDRENNLWVGTSGEGLMRLKSRRFLTFGLESGLKELLVRSVWPSSNGVWAGTYGGGVFEVSDSGVAQVPLANWGIRNGYAQSVLLDRKGRAWIGTFGNALWRIEGQAATQIPRDKTGGQNILALFEDSRGGIWISGGDSISVFDDHDFRVFGPEQGLPFGGVISFAEDRQGAIWVSNESGVFRQVQDRFVEVQVGASTGSGREPRSIPAINCLKTDPDGAIWMGSREQGLLRWQNGQLAGLLPAAAFPSKSVRAIMADEQGLFWMTTERGMIRARRDALHALMDGRISRLPHQLFDATDGLPRADFSGRGQPLCARDQRGRLWFAASKGLVMTDPATFQVNEKPPLVHIEEVSFFRPSSPKMGQTESNRPPVSEVASEVQAPFLHPVSLPPGSRRIEIRYAGLSFAAPEKVRFQVKLEGEDTQWVDAGMQRAAYYHDLAPKDYLFRVRAANNDNVWNETGASLAFVVRPFYWQTVWFQLVVCSGLALAGFGVVWAIIRGKVQDIRERERIHEALRNSEAQLHQGREELNDLLRFERLNADISSTMMRVPAEELGKQIAPAIGQVARLLGFDVATLAVFNGDGSARLPYVWSEPDTPGLPANLTDKDFPWSARELLAGRDVHIRTLEDFPPEAKTDRATYERYGLKSVLDVPVLVSGQSVGVLSMGSFRKELSVSPRLVERQRALGNVFGNALVRARSELALRESEKRLALAAAAGDLGLWLWNLQTKTLWATGRARQMFGLPPEGELTYEMFYARVHPDDRAAVDAGLAAAIASKANYEAEYRICLPEGGEKWIAARGEVAFGNGDQPVSMTGIVSDITERRRDAMELFRHRQELAHISRITMLGELSASLAHELNQPLTAILSNSQAGSRFLASPVPNVTEVREVLQDIANDTKRAGEVIRQMRKLVKKHELQFEALDLNPMIHDVVRLLHSDMVIRKVQIALDFQNELPAVRGDAVQLQQVLINLLLNAFDVMKEVPQAEAAVCVRTRRLNASLVQVEVIDHGTGLRPEKLARLFEPFQTTKPEGLGLGLSISRSIVEAHGGKLTAANNPERGATFSFTVPVEPAPTEKK
jgi:PAS domain S-box-containing protein